MSQSTFHYIDGTLGFPPPFHESGAQFYTFVFSSTQEKLQKVCDHWFNIPAGGAVRCEPLLPVVLVTFARYAQAGPASPPFDQWGFVPYQEVIFSIFAVRLKKVGGTWLAEHVGALVPYIYVDDAIAMVAGREVYGMPKTMASISLPEGPHASPLQFSLETVSTPRFSPDEPFRAMPIASLQQVVPLQAKPLHVWEDMEAAVQAIRGIIFGGHQIHLPSVGLLLEVADIFIEHKLPFSSLRQLRSLSAPDQAAYQSIVDFSARMERFERAGLLPGSFSLSLPENALYPIGEDLGLADGQKAEAAFWLDWDFLFEGGREVWQPAAARLSFWQWLRQWVKQ
jgi:hypothetical protein